MADYLIHPGMFSTVLTEAVVTGAGAALLSSAVEHLFPRVRHTGSNLQN